MNFQYTIFTELSQLNKFKDEWQKLHSQCELMSIYNSFDFIYNSINEFEDDTLKPHIIAIYQDQCLIALFPLQVYFEQRYFLKLKVLEYAAQNEIDKPCPIIKAGHERTAWQGLYLYLKESGKSWDILTLMEFNTSTQDKLLLTELSSSAGYIYRINKDKSGPCINLDKDWDEFWSSHRKMRKKVHKMESDFGEDLCFKANDLPWQEALEQYINLEKRSWKNGKVGINKDEKTRNFYHRLYQSLANKSQLHFGFLYLNGVAVSGEIAYTQGKTVYFCHGCYDKEYQKYSPGMVSTSYFIKHFMGKEYEQGDFLCGYAGYLSAWSEAITETHQIDIYNKTINTRIIFSYRILKKLLTTPLKTTFKTGYDLLKTNR